jgi:DNA-binding Lrp family transcriptional regulator
VHKNTRDEKDILRPAEGVLVDLSQSPSGSVFILDIIDKGILIDLAQNCRASYEGLARKYGITATAIKKRVTSLEKDGVITGFFVELSLAMIDAELVLTIVRTDDSYIDDEFTKAAREYPSTYAILPLSTGDNVVLAESIGMRGLSDLGTFIRSLRGVRSAEVHPLLMERGSKIELASIQLRVLACLVEDARMTVPEIARRSGLKARRARRILKELNEHFTITRNMNVGDSMAILAQISWNPSQMDKDKLEKKLRELYPLEYWFSLASAVEPTIFGQFVVEHIKDVERILGELKKIHGVTQVITHLFFPGKIFPSLSRSTLEEMVADIELVP